METINTTCTVEEMIDNITQAIEMHDSADILQNASYETGLLGYALYYAYLAKYKNEPAYIAKAEDYFNKGINALDFQNFLRVYDTDSLDAHLSHIGRFIEFCNGNQLLDIDGNDYLLQLDGILFDLMKSKVSIKDFDVNSGALASGYFFLSRIRNGAAVEEQLKFLVNSIGNFALQDRDGDYYWKSPALFDRVYIGISHGSCMIISFLVNVYELGIEKELCREIIEKATNFVKKQYRKTKFKGLFPNMVGDKPEPMQFALCYGDIGNGYALYRAGHVLDIEKIKAFAEIVLKDCLTRSIDDNLTLDAGIFYGASGVAVAFEKMAAVSADERFAERAAYWYEKIGCYKIHDNDFAGFKSRLTEIDILWNVSFGWGILGAGIAMMKHEKPELPSLAPLTFVA